MIRIDLREDGWFEAGQDAEESFPFAYMVYGSKQRIKKSIEGIGVQQSMGDLEAALKDVPHVEHFKQTPYLQGDTVMIRTDGPPGDAYLGTVMLVQ